MTDTAAFVQRALQVAEKHPLTIDVATRSCRCGVRHVPWGDWPTQHTAQRAHHYAELAKAWTDLFGGAA